MVKDGRRPIYAHAQEQERPDPVPRPPTMRSLIDHPPRSTCPPIVLYRADLLSSRVLGTSETFRAISVASSLLIVITHPLRLILGHPSISTPR